MLAFSFHAHAQTPKLIVGIVVDQMRYEMLERLAPVFGDDGFNKLRSQGMSFDSCTYTYVPTATSPGHATIYTGKNPKEHGILSNHWYIPSLKKTVYSVADDTHRPVGTNDPSFNRSPHRLTQPTIGDILKKTYGEQSLNYAISLKDRAAILPHGHNGNGAFWMDKEGKFATSTFFMTDLPQWLNDFNNNGYIDQAFAQIWEPLENSDGNQYSLPDDSPFEKKFLGSSATFPYSMDELRQKYGDEIIQKTPWGNEILTQLAIHMLKNTELGRDEVPDLFAISYSATDKAGHDFGPMSAEIQDMYMRLDKDIALLINYLDENFGKEGYLLFLTSDHGVANTPIDTLFSYAKKSELKNALNAFTVKKYKKELVVALEDFQLHLDEDWLATSKIKRAKLDKALIKFLKKQKIVPFEAVYSPAEMLAGTNKKCRMMQQSYVAETAGAVYYTLPFGVMWSEKNYGVEHGTANLYDTHVPFLVYGSNIQPAQSKGQVGVNQILDIILVLLRGESVDW